MLKFARACLDDFGAGDKREDNIGGKALFEIGFHTETVGGIDENACMLRRDDGFDDGGNIVNVRQGLYAEQDVVKGDF